MKLNLPWKIVSTTESLHDLLKTKLLEVSANCIFFFSIFCGYSLQTQDVIYRNAKHIQLHVQVMRPVL